jgi:hypothetical protein
VRRTAWGLGRLERNACVLGLAGATCFAASGAGAAPAPHLFNLTISATSVANFDHTNCNATLQAVGVETATFRSSRPTLVRFVGGRLRPVLMRGLRGSLMLSGSNTPGVVCTRGETPTPAPEACPKTTRTFTKGRVSFSSAAAGSITVQLPRVALQRIHCPEEPAEVVALPLGIAPGLLRVSVATLTNPRTTRITLTATASRTKNYASPERGFVRQRTSWSFTLVRTAR